MSDEQLNPPALDEMELSLFGPGYGESVVIHVGNNSWILIDSCLNPKSNHPASLDYLQQLGVDVKNSVKLIVASHWHDDHVRGISSIYRECVSASLVLSEALDKGSFRKLRLSSEFPDTSTSRGIDEFIEIFRILNERETQNPKFEHLQSAGPNKLVYRSDILLGNRKVDVSAHTLSPSHNAMRYANETLSQFLPKECQPKKRIQSEGPNYFAVVLWIEVNDHKILLGSDLENTGESNTGWSAIIDRSLIIPDKRARVFKVPHHGSSSGHDARLWDRHLQKNSLALLSPFILGRNRLPSEKDLQRIASLTSNAYITAPVNSRHHRYPDGVTRDMVAQFSKNIRNVNQGWGQIRLRCKILDSDSGWDVRLYGSAQSISK